MWDESSQELATAARIVNAQQDVRAIVWLRSVAQYRCLNFVEIQRPGTVAVCPLIVFFQQGHPTLLLRL